MALEGFQDRSPPLTHITMNNLYGIHRAICAAEYGIDSGEGLNFIHAVDIDFLKTADYR